MNERSLSIRWRNEAEVSVLCTLSRSWELSPRLLHGSLLSRLLAILHREKRTGRSGPACDIIDIVEESLRVRAGRVPGDKGKSGRSEALFMPVLNPKKRVFLEGVRKHKW